MQNTLSGMQELIFFQLSVVANGFLLLLLLLLFCCFVVFFFIVVFALNIDCKLWRFLVSTCSLCLDQKKEKHNHFFHLKLSFDNHKVIICGIDVLTL